MHVLIVDDDRSLRHALRKALSRKGATISEAENGAEAIAPLRDGATRGGVLDACVLDVRMPGLDGLEVLRRTLGRGVPVIVLTGHGTIPDAVTAMRLGACNFVQKPVDAEELWPLLEQAVRERRDTSPQGMLGDSAALRTFLAQLERAASSDEPVLLLGETGSGKELAARRLHDVGPRRGSPFVAVNVASIPSELFESELYGHRRGSFTGADRDRVGLFAEAADGTLFIDEVGDLPADAQVKLLRTLEGRCFRPVGANHELPFAGRVVAATHQDLPHLVETGRFRKDLFYRLSVIPLVLPPLRSRGDDILVIATVWLERLQGEHRRLWLNDEAKAKLRSYPFPGNVRELVNLMKRAAIFARSDEIDAPLLDELLRASPFQERSALPEGPAAGQRVTVENLERAHITRLLEELNNVSEVARVAGIDRRTLQRKMIAWGLRDDEE